MHPTIQDSINLIREYQSNPDKSGNIPYYWHLLRVMLRINTEDENVKHIALLHDIVEDTPITLLDLKKMGYNELILNGIKWCSRNEFKEMSFNEWMINFGNNAPIEAVLVKISDISDNLSFERMNGLIEYAKLPNFPISTKDIIDLNTVKKMNLTGNMGVFKRYYDAWNFILSNDRNLNLIKNVNIKDFINLNDISNLKKYLSNNEFNDYIKLNNLSCFELSAHVFLNKDSQNNNYLALHPNKDNVNIFQQFLLNNINSNYISNQINRDKNNFHITFLNSKFFHYAYKDNKELLDNLIGKEFDFFVYGIGHNTKNKNESWYLILENQELSIIRNQMNLPIQDFHITLAFNEKDIHNVSKNKSTLIYNVSDILTESSTLKNKLNFK